MRETCCVLRENLSRITNHGSRITFHDLEAQRDHSPKLHPSGQSAVSPLVFRNVPAEVCANCGEAYISEEITAQLLEEAEEAVQARVQVGVRELTPVTI